MFTGRFRAQELAENILLKHYEHLVLHMDNLQIRSLLYGKQLITFGTLRTLSYIREPILHVSLQGTLLSIVIAVIHVVFCPPLSR